MRRSVPPARLARRWFWTLLAAGVLAVGVLSVALRARPGPSAGLTVLGSGLVLILATSQAARILSALKEAGRRMRPEVAGPLSSGDRAERPRAESSRDGRAEGTAQRASNRPGSAGSVAGSGSGDCA